MLYQRRVCLSVLMACVLGLVFLPITSARADCPEGTTSYWTLDETSGNTYGDSVNGNHGVGNAGPIPATGLVFGAQDFDGSTTGIDVEPDDSFDWGLNDSFSIEYWVKAEGGTEDEVVVGRDEPSTPGLHWWTGLRPGGGANFTLQDTDGVAAEVQGTTNLRNGEWHHIVAVRDPDTDPNEIRLYIDGGEEASVAADDYTAGFDSETAKLNFGYLNRNNVPDHHFKGTLDEVAIYDRVLSAEEISQHYNDGVGMSYCGDVARYSLTVNTAGAGTGTVNPDGGVYHEGTTVLLTADPATGSAFFKWTDEMGDLIDHANPTAVAMTSDKTVTAAFEPDSDADGVSDLEEQGPPDDPNYPDVTYSGNGEDLTPDWQEANVTSMRTHDGQNYVTLEVEDPATLSGCSTVPPPPDGPAGVLFPYGWFGFTVEGAADPPGETTVKLYLPGATTTYYKYGPTPADPTDHLYEFLFNDPPGEATGAEINGNTVTLHFIDGGRGDDNLGDDDKIIDQGGPGAPPGGGAAPVGGGGGGGGGCFISNLAYGLHM